MVASMKQTALFLVVECLDVSVHIPHVFTNSRRDDWKDGNFDSHHQPAARGLSDGRDRDHTAASDSRGWDSGQWMETRIGKLSENNVVFVHLSCLDYWIIIQSRCILKYGFTQFRVLVKKFFLN